MRLRKTRTHETGSSNLDYKGEKLARPEVDRIEFLSTAKSKNFSELVSMRVNKIAPQPLKEMKTFYNENQLEDKDRYPVGYPRFAQLEEIELRKPVFTGDSNTQYETKKLREVKRNNTFIDKKESRKKLIAQKHDQHANAIAETQLVGFEQYNKETLEGKVDLEKVKEIRRAIRRRYANRNNFQKIFNAWDDDCTGVISVTNAFEMIKNLGIKVNYDEARVLIASADMDKSGDLSLNEFMDLIFNSTDVMNVNLKELPVIPESVEHNLDQANEVMSKHRDDVAVQRLSQHHNQLSVILKNKLSSLKTHIFAADSLNQGFVSHEKFFEIIKKLAIPETIMSQKDIQHVFNNHKIDEHKFNYRQFVDFLRDFEFVPLDIYVDPAETAKKKNEKQKFLTAFNYEEDKKINIFDAQSADAWQLEKIRSKARRVFRIIERYLSSKESFDSFLMAQMKVTNPAEFESKQVSKATLTKAIENLFLNVGDKDVSKDEVESFLSIFSYNVHDHTQAASISHAIYSEDDGDWFKKMQWKLKRPPPPPQQQREGGASAGAEGDGSDSQAIAGPAEASDEVFDQYFDTRYKPQSMSMRQYQGLTRTSSEPHFPSKVNKMLTKFENRIFCGTQKAYDIFKKFDVDKDGYVSRKDMALKLREMNILEEREIQPFLGYLDPTNKGFVDFAEFSAKIRVGMTNNDDHGRQLVIPFNVPSADHLKDTAKMLPFIQERVNDLRKPFFPPESMPKNTRFSASPGFQDTFSNFKVSAKSPMFSTVSEQFLRSHNHRTDFQKTEHSQKKMYEEGRIQRRREH